MANMKEFNRELELVKKGAEVLKNSMDMSARHGIEIIELQKRIDELEKRFASHINNEYAHEI